MTKKWILCANLLLLTAWVLFALEQILWGGIAFLLVIIWEVVYKWNKTHNIVYVVLTAVFFVFILLQVVWFYPKEILPVGWICLPLVGLIVLEIFQKTKN